MGQSAPLQSLLIQDSGQFGLRPDKTSNSAGSPSIGEANTPLQYTIIRLHNKRGDACRLFFSLQLLQDFAGAPRAIDHF